MAVDVKQLIQELVVPELREIKAEVKGLQTELKRLEEKSDLQSARLENKIDIQGARLDDKIDVQIAKLDDKIEAQIAKLDDKIEAQIAKLDDKIDAQGAKLDDKIDAQGAKLDDKISSLRNEMLTEFRRLDEKIDLTLHVQERLVALETRMAAYETRN